MRKLAAVLLGLAICCYFVNLKAKREETNLATELTKLDRLGIRARFEGFAAQNYSGVKQISRDTKANTARGSNGWRQEKTGVWKKKSTCEPRREEG